MNEIMDENSRGIKCASNRYGKLDGSVIWELYGSFLEHLRRHKEDIAVLQLTGKIEQFFVVEFVKYVYEFLSGDFFALTNIGNKKEPKRDIVILSKKFDRHEEGDKNAPKAEMDCYDIEAMFEFKYLRNRHRIFRSSAKDEISGTLKNLSEQLYTKWAGRENCTHGGFNVVNKQVYGVIFASYVEREEEYAGENQSYSPDKNTKMNEFYEYIITKCHKYNLYLSKSEPYPSLDSVYINENVPVFDSSFKVSLKAGLLTKAYTME